MTQALASLDFDRHRRLLEGLLAGLREIRVRDTGGQLVHRHECAAGLSCAEADQTEWTVTLGEEYAPLGLLTVLLTTRAEGEVERRALADVAAGMTRECTLAAELDSMADELASRYEELNLVYSTADQARDFGQGQAMLRQLVRNCIDYLDIDLAILLLPDKNIAIVEHRAGQAQIDTDLLLHTLREGIMRRLATGQAFLVINTTQDAQAAGLRTTIPYKLMAQSIPEGDHPFAGLLAVVGQPQRHDFANNDRKLLEVMVGKAAKLLQANFDAATGLMTRSGFEHHLRDALLRSRRDGEQACVLGVDVDRMTVVNDTLGRQAGDALIVRLAQLIRQQVRDTDVVARLGGDEFGILLGNCPVQQASGVAEKLIEQTGQMDFRWLGQRLDVSLSVGIVPIDDASEDIEQILTHTDLACRAAKERGSNHLQVFQSQDGDLVARKQAMHWVTRLQAALREDRFLLHAQLIAPNDPARHRTHYEVLIRLPGDDGRMLPPGLFLPSAERYGLMPAIDRWVFQRVLHELNGLWRETGRLEAVFSVNLSGNSLSDMVFLEYLANALGEVAFPLDRLCLEITETAAIDQQDRAQEFIARIKAMGCTFALDDFGAGLSSYAYLKNLDVDLVKIDGSFVRNILEDPVSDVMVQSVVAIARQMGILTVAEFVENEAIRERLRTLEVDYVQGYGVGKPTPLSDILAELGAGGMGAGGMGARRVGNR